MFQVCLLINPQFPEPLYTSLLLRLQDFNKPNKILTLDGINLAKNVL